MIDHLRTIALLTLLSVAAVTGFAVPAFAQSEKEVNATLDELFGEHKPYQTFFAALKKAVSGGDKQAIAAMVDYPITVDVSGKDVTLKSAHDLVGRYDKVFTKKIVTAVEKQSYGTLFANDEGVMIGDGEIWFGGICSDNACKHQTVKITAINSDN